MIASAAAMAASPMAPAHDTPNLEHTHAFEKTGYGTYRQGHSVNGPLGSITIWSPRPYTGYQSGPVVKFAHPEPITKAPGTPAATPPAGRNSAPGYGQSKSKQRGN